MSTNPLTSPEGTIAKSIAQAVDHARLDVSQVHRRETPKVGILTYHFSDNFGAVMQAYALRQWFLRRGCKAEFINYHPRYVEEGGSIVIPKSLADWRRNIKTLYLRFSFMRRQLFGNAQQRGHFAAFAKQELGVTQPRLEHADGLDKLASDYDLLVCGSDQIWNPSLQRGLDPAYFLAFGASSQSRRISYAASFGKAELDAAFRAEAGRLLSDLDAISVREQSGVTIVQAISGREAVCVPDPTILHGDFRDLLAGAPMEESGHIFCYALRTGDGIRDVATLAAAEAKTKILSPYNAHRRWPEIGLTVYPSPQGWLRLLNDSAMVVTNSFHGTALSILLRRPFVVVGLSGKRMDLNERVGNLLRQLKLVDRFVDANDLGSVAARLRQPIDWQAVDQGVQQLRSDGNSFLDRELAKLGHGRAPDEGDATCATRS